MWLEFGQRYWRLCGLMLAGWMFITPVPAQQWQSPLLQDHPLVGKIIDLHGGKAVSQQTLMQDLRSARLVLIGEKHDNPDHHAIESRLLGKLIGGTPNTAVVFEMLDDSQRQAVDGLTANMSLAEMKTQLHWPARGWDWAVYGPLFRRTLQLGARLVPGNVNHDQLQAVYASGPAVLKGPRFETMNTIEAERKAVMLDQIYESHCEMMPRDALAPMVEMQLAKDASMASALVAAQADKAILIAGGFHVSKLLGVPRHLRQRVPAADVRVVMLMEVSEDGQTPQDYLEDEALPADYLWFTPKATDKDYCAGLRARHATPK